MDTLDDVEDGTFEETLSLARDGDERAWSLLLTALAPKVLGYIRSFGAADPDDVLGEVFFNVVRSLPGFTGGEDDFRSWVFTIAHHRTLDAKRKRARRPDETVALEAIGEQPGGDVEEEALERLSEEHARAVIGTLAEDRKTVLLLRLFGGLELGQIAKIMHRSTGAVKQLQRRGLLDLKRRLDQGGTPIATAGANRRGWS